MPTSPTSRRDLEDDFTDAQIRVALRLLAECTDELVATSARLNSTTPPSPSVVRATASRFQRLRIQQFRAALEGFLRRLPDAPPVAASGPPPLPGASAAKRPVGRASRPRIEIEIVAAGDDDSTEITPPWRFRRRIVGTLPTKQGASEHVGR